MPAEAAARGASAAGGALPGGRDPTESAGAKHEPIPGYATEVQRVALKKSMESQSSVAMKYMSPKKHGLPQDWIIVSRQGSKNKRYIDPLQGKSFWSKKDAQECMRLQEEGRGVGNGSAVSVGGLSGQGGARQGSSGAGGDMRGELSVGLLAATAAGGGVGLQQMVYGKEPGCTSDNGGVAEGRNAGGAVGCGEDPAGVTTGDLRKGEYPSVDADVSGTGSETDTS
jgi:hypothetical protein